MSELTLHTGFMGSIDTIGIRWFDENNVYRYTDIRIEIENRDKPRTLSIRIDGQLVKRVDSTDKVHIVD